MSRLMLERRLLAGEMYNIDSSHELMVIMFPFKFVCTGLQLLFKICFDVKI